ncbi:MAG: DUF4153 domain-containing protein [Bacteroidota bacterium]
MKLPSLRQLWKEAFDTYKRFPFTILSAAAGTASAIIIVQNEMHASYGIRWLYNAAAIAFLGISFFIALQLIAENKKWSFSRALIVKLCALFLLIVYYLLLPRDIFESASIHVIRYFLFIIAAHMFVAFAAFMERGRIAAFWEFNKTLFLRFVTAALYTTVLYTGMAVALLAVNQLFAVEIRGERYFQLWWLLAGLFNTWFFLSGIPRGANASDTDVNYPKGLKVFTQYVMIPLVAVYLCILYAYMGKIIIQWDWPKGWVGYLVLGFSTTGIFSLLLIHPIKDRRENAWMSAAWRWFYVFVLPLTALLLLAVWRRISDYGITELRYFIIVLGLWLAAISLYFLLSKTKSIKLIPLSLCAIALLVSFGPWGAFSISKNNQMQRLEQILTKNNLLMNGKAHKAKNEIPFADVKRISALTRYLTKTHGVEVLQPWFAERIDTVCANHSRNGWYNRNDNPRRIAQLLGVPYVDVWEGSDSNERTRTYTFRSDSMVVVPLEGYRYLAKNITVNRAKKKFKIDFGNDRWNISLDTAKILFMPVSGAGSSFSVDLKDRISLLCSLPDLREYVNILPPEDSMQLSVEHGNLRMQIFITAITIDVRMKSKVPSALTMDIVLGPGIK